MKLPDRFRPAPLPAARQRGIILFFTLIALLAISLAAVALVRSTDTSTMIAGNLTFKQSATASADAGVEAAIGWLAATEAANSTVNVLNNPAHPFNNDAPAAGYYSSLNPALSVTDGIGIQWNNTDSMLAGTDAQGNTTRYVIQRMCRTANTPIQAANCLFSSALEDKNGQAIPLPQEVCVGPGCPAAGQTPQIRITSRTTGPRNTVSYVQAFVY